MLIKNKAPRVPLDYNDTFTLRIVCLIGGIVSPIISLIWETAYPDLNSSTLHGWLFSVMFLLILFLTYKSKYIKENVIYILYGIFYIASFTEIYIAYINRFSEGNTLLLILVVFVASLLFRTPNHLLTYNIVTVIFITAALLSSNNPGLNPHIIMLMFIVFSVIAYVISASRYEMIRSLHESNQRTLELMEQIRVNDERWRLALAVSEKGVWDWNVGTNEVVYSNEWKKHLGYDENELNNNFDEWYNRIHPEDREKFTNDLKKHMEGKSDDFINKHRLLCKDGTYKWVLDVGKVISREIDGKPLRVIGTYTDVTKLVETEQKLEKSLSLINAIIQSSSDGVLAEQFIGDKDKSTHNIITYNQTFLDIFGLSKDYSNIYSATEVIDIVADCAKDGDAFFKKIKYLYDNPEEIGNDLLEFKNNKIIERISIPYRINNKTIGRIWSFRDITNRIRMEENLKRSEEKFKDIFAESPIGIQIIDGTCQLIEANASAMDMMGVKNIFELKQIYKMVKDDVKNMITPGESLRFVRPINFDEIPDSTKSGLRYFDILVNPLTRNSEFLVQLQDITELKRSQDSVRQLAYYDFLTGLPNRKLFTDRLEQVLLQSKRNGNMFSLLFIDMDNFKRVNDNYGHSAGDMMLIEVANRLKKSVRRSDTVARLGGDEFVILLPFVKNKWDIKEVVERIMNNFKTPIKINELNLSTTPSIGISIFPNNGQTIDELLKKADDAMYNVKDKNGFGYEFSK